MAAYNEGHTHTSFCNISLVLCCVSKCLSFPSFLLFLVEIFDPSVAVLCEERCSFELTCLYYKGEAVFIYRTVYRTIGLSIHGPIFLY